MADALMRSNVMICEGTGCAASQAREILTALKGEVQRHGLEGEIRIVQTVAVDLALQRAEDLPCLGGRTTRSLADHDIGSHQGLCHKTASFAGRYARLPPPVTRGARAVCLKTRNPDREN